MQDNITPGMRRLPRAGALLSSLIAATMLTGGIANSQADPVIANADFEEQIAGTNKPADWTDEGGNVMAMNNNGGQLNLSLPDAFRTIGPNAFRGVAQDVDLTGVQYLIFDAGSENDAPDWVEVAVRIGADQVWSASLAGTYSDQAIDVSGYVGVHRLSLRIQSTRSEVSDKPPGISAGFFFDNLRTVKPDTTPPTVTCSLAQNLLWPPNNKMANVGLDAVVVDDRDAHPSVQMFVYSNEADEGAAGAALGADGSLLLRAERSGGGHGRVYLIVVVATDAAGNVGFDCCTVMVPHNQSKKSMANLMIEAALAETHCLESGAVPDSYHLIGNN